MTTNNDTDEKLSSDVQRVIAYIYSKDVVHYSELMKLLNVSRKKVPDYLDLVEQALQGTDVKLVRKRNVGIYFEGDFEKFKQRFQDESQLLNLDAIGRENLILLRLLIATREFTMAELCQRFFISGSTLDRDIRLIKPRLAKAHLELTSNNHGLYVKGSERDKRNIASTIIAKYWRESVKENLRVVNFPDSLNDLIDKESLVKVQRVLHRLQRQTGISFTEYQYQSLLIHICISTLRIKDNRFLQDSNYGANKFCSETTVLVRLLEEELNIHIPDTEREYLNIHILAAKKNRIEVTDFEQHTQLNSKLQTISDFLNYELTDADDQLINDLSIHLEPALHRFQVGLQAFNPYTREIIKLYPQAFEMAFELSQAIDKRFVVRMDKNEIAYLALHFEAFIERKQPNTATQNTVSIVVICSTGMGTARLLTQRIRRYFSQLVTIKRVISVSELLRTKISEDLVVSTLPLEIPDKQVIVIEPFFSQDERELLKKQIIEIRKRKQAGSNAFIKLLNKKMIFANGTLDNQTAVINYVGRQLIRNNFANQGVIEAALEREQVASTVIEKGLAAIPHTASQYILNSSISIYVNPAGITWGDDRIKVVFFIGFSDQDLKTLSLDEVYKYFDRLLASKKTMSEIVAAKSSEQIIEVIHQFYQ